MIAGMLWGVDSLDPGGGRINNAWFIFLLVFFGVTVAGVLAEIIAGEVKKRGGREHLTPSVKPSV